MEPPSSTLDPAAPRAGQVVAGRYRLIAPVGAGALASVWEAEHVTLHSRYAVKFLHQTGPASGEPAQRFLREARIAASIKHRNVLEIVDFGFMEGEPGMAERGVPYMVMELLRGRTLGTLLAEKGPLEVHRAVDIASGVLRGLAAVHAAGLLHRDVKPHNVFLVEDEDGAFPKLVDFGLSRRTGRSDLTAEGTMLGTPLYMAPEQIAASGDLDARADIYAMGVVLYEMLAGAPPFNAPSIVELLDLVAFTAPPPLRERRPDVPEALVHVVETALQKTRERRFADARVMRAALLDAMSQGPPSGEVALPMPLDTVRAVRTEDATAPARIATRSASAPVRAADTIARPDAQDEPPEREATPVPAAAPQRENAFVVFVRATVLAAIAIGVAVLVLDGPWSARERTDAALPDAGEVVAADAGVPSMAEALTAVEPQLERELLDAGEAPDAGAGDAGADADAGVDAGADAGDDAGEDAGADAGDEQDDVEDEDEEDVEDEDDLVGEEDDLEDEDDEDVEDELDQASAPVAPGVDAGASRARTVRATRHVRRHHTVRRSHGSRRHHSRGTRRRHTRTRRPR